MIDHITDSLQSESTAVVSLQPVTLSCLTVAGAKLSFPMMIVYDPVGEAINWGVWKLPVLLAFKLFGLTFSVWMLEIGCLVYKTEYFCSLSLVLVLSIRHQGSFKMESYD